MSEHIAFGAIYVERSIPGAPLNPEQATYLKRLPMIHIVTYDLKSPGQDYKDLFKALTQCGDTRRPLESVWWVHSNMSAQQLYDRLRHHIDPNDRLLISAMNHDHQGWLSKDDWNWLNSRMLKAA